MSGREEGRARPGPNGPGDDGDDGAPAHVHGRRRAVVRGRHDRRSLVARLPVVVVLAVAVAGAVAVDSTPDADTVAAPAAGRARPESLMPVSSPGGTGSSTWYCAAGTAEAGGMADHTVTILNTGDDELEATLTVFAGSVADAGGAEGEPDDTTPASGVTTETTIGDTTTDTDAAGATRPEQVVELVDLPAHGRVDVRLGDLVEAQLAAALVEVGGADVVVEHRVAGEHGADVAPCATVTAPTWHLAWGATTRDARDVVVLFNPFPTSATVDAVFTTEDGPREPVRFQGLPVPAGSVVGIDVGAEVTRSEHVSATFEARSGRVVVEHLQQFDGSLGPRGLSLALGVPVPGETWVFADGEASLPAPATPSPGAPSDETAGTEGDDEAAAGEGDDETPVDESGTTERIVVYNPGEERAEVDVHVIPSTDDVAPAPQPFGLSVAPGGYQVIDYGDQDRIAAGVPHTTVVRSTNHQPVVAERVTIDQGAATRSGRSGNDPPERPGELTAATGSRLAAPRWVFSSVAEPDDAGTMAFVVFNPDPTSALEVRLQLVGGAAELDANRDTDAREGAPAHLSPVGVAPGARVVIELDDDQAAAQAAIVEAGAPVVVERIVRLADGRRRTLGAGVPEAGGAVFVDDLAQHGLLAGLIVP